MLNSIGVSPSRKAPSQPEKDDMADGAPAQPEITNPESTAGRSTSGVPPVNPRRRRGFDVVTPIACTECRKKRAKCDGQQPCGRCKSQKVSNCDFEIPVKRSKEDLRTEIESLRERQHANDQVMAAVLGPNMSEVLARLRVGQSIDSIFEWISNTPKSGGSASPASLHHPNFGASNTLSSGLARSPKDAGSSNFAATARGRKLEQSSPGHIWSESDIGEASIENTYSEYISGSTPRFPGLEQVLWPLGSLEMGYSPGTWTNLTSNLNLVHHLLALYFCWEYPIFAPFSKESFLRDFQNERHRYCSPLLVNALLALGCRWSIHPFTRANPNDPSSSGDHFFDEALRLLDLEMDHRSLTTVQSLGVMSIREMSCGRHSQSVYFSRQSLRLAIEMGLHQRGDEEIANDDDLLSIQSSTFWGAFCLDNVLSLATGSLPQYSYLSPCPPRPVIIDSIEASLWVPYTDDGIPLQIQGEQPSNLLSVYKCFCELTEIICFSLFVLHSPVKPLTAEILLSVYTKYLHWYDDMPVLLRLGYNSTPAVLYVHMYYHFAILQLFRPFLKIQVIKSEISSRNVCHQAADAIQGLLQSYSQLYTLRRTSSLVPSVTLASAVAHIDILVTTQTYVSHSNVDMQSGVNRSHHVYEAVRQDISHLREMATCHRSAEQAVDLLGCLANTLMIDVDLEGDRASVEDYNRLIKPCTNGMDLLARRVRRKDFAYIT